jgi:collagenase-like PrtC family protease
MIREIELLAPAKNLECGIAAIDHGADAVYIGASNFGARVAAGNSVEDIEQLCQYAHQYNAKVYVTINTIIYDDEIIQVENLIRKLNDIGVDAILVQDMAILKICNNIKSKITLHASTQTDNRNIDKIKWLKQAGFKRAVLARELSLKEINAIHKAVPDIELEVFVHGALCVSYSGACYASEYCFHRSANRGNCAQFCRLKFDLKDGSDNIIQKDKYMLSLKDMCRIHSLKDLLEAGATSLKIEGRLKNVSYVKNVVAAYSQELNRIIASYPDKYKRASNGKTTYSFKPDLSKTFNRGFTDYFLYGRKPGLASVNTPKAIGEFVGSVKEIWHNSFSVSGTKAFSNGDGLCFINENQQLEGFRVNKVVNNRLFPLKMPENLKPHMALYRNNDQLFENKMSATTAKRKIGVKMFLSASQDYVELTIKDDAGHTATEKISYSSETAKKSQEENMKLQLGKLGNTLYEADEITISPGSETRFIPSSILAGLRRDTLEKFSHQFQFEHSGDNESLGYILPNKIDTNNSAEEINIANVANKLARQLYDEIGPKDAPDAFETTKPNRDSETQIMTCRYCIRYEMGYCTKQGRKAPWQEPLYLVLKDNRKFRLKFDCLNCQMRIYAEK